MAALFALIITLGTALLAVTAYMEWIGVLNLFTASSNARCDSCARLKLYLSPRDDRCWRRQHASTAYGLHGIHR